MMLEKMETVLVEEILNSQEEQGIRHKVGVGVRGTDSTSAGTHS